MDDIWVSLRNPTDSSYEEMMGDTYSYEKDELQVKQDNLWAEACLLRIDFEIIQAQQCQILLQAWICKNEILSKRHWSKEYLQRLRELDRKLETRGIKLKNVQEISGTVLQSAGYTSDFSEAGLIAHYLMLDWNYAVYDAQVMRVLAALLMDLMDVDSLEEILKTRRMGRKLVFGEMEPLVTDEYKEAKAKEILRESQLLPEDELEYEVPEIPWIQLFEDFDKKIVENTKLQDELDEKLNNFCS